MNFEGKRVTRRGSRILEKDYLCSKCYVQARQEKTAMHFSSVKKRRKNKSEGSSNNTNSDSDTVSSSSTTTGTITPTETRSTVVSTTKHCIVCSSTKTYGPWGKVEGIISH